MENELLKQSLRDLLLALRNMPQCYTFSDISSKVEAPFRQEIDRILAQLAPTPLPNK